MKYGDKLQNLRNRRQGYYTRDGRMLFAEAASALKKSEKFEALTQPRSVKYAIGAMQPVDDDYTRESYDEGTRVAKALAARLPNAGIPVAFEFQGSVPLNVHVRRNSDVDVLAIHDGFVTHDPNVLPVYASYYGPSLGVPVNQMIQNLRTESESALKTHFYGATVDTSGARAITLSDGAFKRHVDVVPAHWHNTFLWHQTGAKQFRDVYVWDNHGGHRLHNRPFMHMKLIDEKCAKVGGGLRKVIRLLKNIKYDSPSKIDLSSYDIAALAWHMEEASLSVPYGMDLTLVDRAKSHLLLVAYLDYYRDGLMVPDESRKIFDDPKKVVAVRQLYAAVAALAEEIYAELDPMAKVLNQEYRGEVLAKAIVL